MAERSSKRADELAVGDVLDIRGQLWTVGKVKPRGKWVRLRVESRRGRFTDEVNAGQAYTVVVESSSGARERVGKASSRGGASISGPLATSQGAQARWATVGEARELTAPAEVGGTRWDKVAKADRPVVDGLGARLVGVEVEGGKLIVPPVTDATVFGHLLTMHGRRFDGVTVAEAKGWVKANDPGGVATAEQVIDALTYSKAYALHEELHRDLAGIPRPHWHRERAPK